MQALLASVSEWWSGARKITSNGYTGFTSRINPERDCQIDSMTCATFEDLLQSNISQQQKILSLMTQSHSVY